MNVRLAMLALLGLCPIQAVAEAPPYQRLLQGGGHWQWVAAAPQQESLPQAAHQTAKLQPALAEVSRLEAEAQALNDHLKFADAEPLLRKVLAVREDVQGPKHPDTATSYHNLAVNLHAQGKHREAEPLLRKALAVREEVLGPKHPDTGTSYSTLASNLGAQGRPRDAELFIRKALVIWEEVLGPKHPYTAMGYNNLALKLSAQGRTREAEPLLRKALAAWEEVHGPKHPDTALGYANLGMNLKAQGRTREAEPLLRKALAVREEVLGPKHPDTVRSYNNLALNLDAQGRHLGAEPLYRKALTVREQILGPKHPDIVHSYNGLANNLSYQGQLREAELLFRKALAVREEVLGSKHADTAISYHNLALNLDDQGRSREAEPLYRKALAIFEEVLGPKHRDTATSYVGLAYNLDHQGRRREAEPLYRKALAIFEEIQGPKHPDTAGNCNNLALNLDAQGRLQEAEPLYRRALAVREEVLGPKHPSTARSYDNLAGNLRAQGRLQEAEPLYRRALAVREEVLGPKHPDTASNYNNLAANLDAQCRLREAEPLYRRALAVREEVLGRKHPNTALSYYNLASNVQGQGRPHEAEPYWRAAVEALEAARLRLAATGLDRASAVRIQPHVGLALCLALRSQAVDAWQAAEAGLGRGLLDDLTMQALSSAEPAQERRLQDRAARLEQLDRLLLRLLTRTQLSEKEEQQREELTRERASLHEAIAQEAAEISRQEVYSLARIQKQIPADAALLFWLDQSAAGSDGHWACIVRREGVPAWVRLPGSDPNKAWTAQDDQLPGRLRTALAENDSAWRSFAQRLAVQRFEPLAAHFGAGKELPAVQRLLVIPAGTMAGVPLEALTDQFTISYVPSGTVYARQREHYRPLDGSSLLALGDPAFGLPAGPSAPVPPDHGILLTLVLPDGNAAKAGLRSGDVLLRYAGKELTSAADLQVAEAGDKVPVAIWREGKILDSLQVGPGKLGVSLSREPVALALRRKQELELLADARRRDEIQPLPGSRFEVQAISALFPKVKCHLLLGTDASEQRLDELIAARKLKGFRLLHFATHGQIDPVGARQSALLLARDQLPDPLEQQKRGLKMYDGRLTVATIGHDWEMDADLVTLSACETGLGPKGGGDGLLGFSQVLFRKGARSLVLSLWKVDDTATALLMNRFYENLLGRRSDLKAPLPRAEALRQAKQWLREMPLAERDRLAAALSQGDLRGSVVKKDKPVVPAPRPGEQDRPPYADPYYWAAFILLGDPE